MKVLRLTRAQAERIIENFSDGTLTYCEPLQSMTTRACEKALDRVFPPSSMSPDNATPPKDKDR